MNSGDAGYEIHDSGRHACKWLPSALNFKTDELTDKIVDIAGELSENLSSRLDRVANDLNSKTTALADMLTCGDLMARWTNGLYKSTMHRVRNNNAAKDRYSLPFFYSPRPTAVVECLPTCTDRDNPPKYAPCTVREHMDEMFRRSYGFKPGAKTAAN